MGGSARYRYGKKIRAARDAGASDEEIAELERQRERAIESEKFRKALQKAKASQDDDKAWRVDVHDSGDYHKDRLYTTDGGSTIAITPDGDIISVCKNINDKAIKGTQLLEKAVEMGGVKLDSYEGNHKFYIKCGFEPVSWCEWNPKFAPDDWNAERDKPEPIIFYRYVGHPVTETAAEFMARVPASKGTNPKTGMPDPDYDYGVAMEVRDGLLKTE